jgi:hypothetical protein
MMTPPLRSRLEARQAQRAAKPRQINILRKNGARMTGKRQIDYSLASLLSIVNSES